MVENNDEVVTEYNKGFFGKIRGFFGSIPGLIFIVGIALIIGGILMQSGYFDMSDEPKPSTTVNESSNDNSVSDETNDESSASTVISDGVETTIYSGKTYIYGEYTVIASTLVSTCDEYNNCNLETNSLILSFTDSNGNTYPFTLNTTNYVIQAGIGQIRVNSWGQNFVNIQIN